MKYTLLLATLLIITGCTSEVDGPDINQERRTGHFPLEIGHVVEYKVIEVVFRQEGMIRDTLTYELREEIAGSFLDDTGSKVYVVDRHTRAPGSPSWQYDESWQAMIEESQVIRIEENRRYVKLRLPIRSGDEWDGNGLFDATAPIIIGGNTIDYYKNWRSKLVGVNQQVQLENISIDNVHTVSLADYDNRLELRYGQEMYADGIGLIHRELRILDTQCFENCNGLSWEEKAEQGHIYIQSLLN